MGETSIDYSALLTDLSDSDSDTATDPVLDALQTGIERDLEDLRDISAAVRFVKSSRSVKSIGRFHQLKMLAMLDKFTDKTEQAKAKILKKYWKTGTISESKRKASHMRTMKTYKDIVKKLTAATARLQRPADVGDLISRGAPDAVQLLHREVVRGTTPKMRSMAAKEFTDRVAPKTKRGDDARALAILDAVIAKQLVEGLEILTNAGALPAAREPKPIDVSPPPKALPESPDA